MSYGRNGANDGRDFLGRELKVGQQVCKAHVFGRSPGHELKTVSKVEDGEVYLNGWHSPVQYSGRLVIVSDAEDGRYKTLRDELYQGEVYIGEAEIIFNVIGACPSTDEFDAAIDGLMEDRYTVTPTGRAMLKDGES